MPTCCFYDDGGSMVGVDKHTFFADVSALPAPIPETPHLVAVGPFSWPAWPAKRTAKVTAEGRLMIQDGFSNTLIPHIPMITAPPHLIAEGAMIAFLLAASKSSPIFNASTVHGEGKPLAVCFYTCVGLNKNCGGTGLVVNSSSVVTTPTLGDYVAGGVGVAIGRWTKDLIANPVARWVVEKFVIKPYVTPFVKDKVRELVDDLD